MNNNTVRMTFILSMVFALSFINCSYAWDASSSHRLITEYAIKQSVLDAAHGDYLEVLGFSSGVDTPFSWDVNHDGRVEGNATKTVIQWIRDEGARLEDGNFRELNHFFNPLKPWNEAGLWGVSSLWKSAVIWSQDSSCQATWTSPSGIEQPYQGIITIPDSNPLTDWSWQTTRNYFYSALTAHSDNDRQSDFAKMFVGLGHQMHLLDDMSVPAHVRNNSHLLYRMIEPRMTKTIPDMNHLVLIAPNPVIPSVSLANSINGLAPVARLFDTDAYTSTTRIAVNDISIGLAEWTNANFFSDDTIFSPEFPHPAKANTNAHIIEIQAEDGARDNRFYVKLNGQDYKLAAYSYLHDQVPTEMEGWKYILDEQVYDDNLKMLLPRAVGYSAALLNYFFRGQIDMVPDSVEPGTYVIKNNSSEHMSGRFELFYDDVYDNRIFITSWDLDINANGQSSPLNFTKPVDPRPKDKGKYMLVFTGAMGGEAEAVAGKTVILEEEDVEYRVVTVYNKPRDYNSPSFGTITIYTNKGVITGKLPLTGYDQVHAVRLDVKNKNVFAVLTSNYDYGLKKSFYSFHSYLIDESEMVLSYRGVVLREEAFSRQETRRQIYEEDMGYLDDFWTVDGPIFYKMHLVEGTTKEMAYSDFFLKNDTIKPFGMITETSYSYPVGGFYAEDGTFLSDDHGSYYYLTYIQNQQLYYGGTIVQAQPYNCTGGFFIEDRPDYERCQTYAGISLVRTGDFIAPAAIFNDSDYAYRLNKPNGSVEGKTTLSLSLPYFYNGTTLLRTMLRENEQYSFYENSQAPNTPPLKSYSSELGIVNCEKFLLSDKSADGGYIGWHASGTQEENGAVINYKDCSNWQYLFPTSGTNFDYAVFDVNFW